MTSRLSIGAQILGGTLLALLLAEGALRLVWGDSSVQPPIYASAQEDGLIGLLPGVEVEGRLHSGQRYAIRVDPRGLRLPVPEDPDWLLAGDSLPFGLGVDGEQAAAAALTAAGIPAASVGVPAASLADALALAARLSPRGLVVLPNAVDDDRQGTEILSDRYVVVGARLLRRESPAWARRVYASPLLIRSQLVREGMRLLALLVAPPSFSPRPLWATAEDGGYEHHAALGRMVRDFALQNPEADVRVVWIPLDVVAAPGRRHPSPYGRVAQRAGETWSDEAARAGLRAGLGEEVPWLDLSAAFAAAGEEVWLDGDTHLSEEGHALLACALAPWLREPGQEHPAQLRFVEAARECAGSHASKIR